ncbi:MAG: hypothetical protein AB1428_01850 [Bacteroidota bacterium]
MKNKGRFPLQVGMVLAGSAALIAFPLVQYGTPEIVWAVAAGALLSTVNVLLGYVAIEYSFEKSYTTFVKAVLGGMGLRMAAMLAALTALIVFGGMHAVALTVSVMGFYAVYLVMEIVFIQRKVSLKNRE